MNRQNRSSCLLFAAVLLVGAIPTLATDGAQLTERTRIEFGGAAGKVAKVFAGKAARGDGLERRIAVTPTRKATLTGEQREVIDLDAQAIWTIGKNGRSCEKTTFAELRERWESLREGMPTREQMQRPQDEGGADTAPPVTYVVETEIETGAKRSVAGYDGVEKIVRLTVHQEGKTLEEGGGSIVEMTMVQTDADVPALRVLRAFDERYAALMVETAGFDLENLKNLVLANPAVGEALAKLREGGFTADGTILSTSMDVQAIAGPGRTAPDADEDDDGSAPKSARGMAGRFAQKMLAKRRAKDADDDAGAEPKRVYGSDNAFVEIGDDPDPSLLQLPDSCPG